MRNFFTIWRRDLAACFLSPVAYVTMVVFLALSGWAFLDVAAASVGTREQLPALLFRVLVFFWLPVLVTVITMRLFAEEKRSGTIEMLMTAPVSEAEVVLGKYAGALTFFLAVTLPALASLFILSLLAPSAGEVDLGALAGGCLILVLIAAFCIAIGLFVSMTTRNQIVAAICTFCAVLLPLLAGYLVSVSPFATTRVVEHCAAEAHVLDYARGIIDTRAIVLYVSGTVFVLFCSVRLLEWSRWR